MITAEILYGFFVVCRCQCSVTPFQKRVVAAGFFGTDARALLREIQSDFRRAGSRRYCGLLRCLGTALKQGQRAGKG
jgi:hypothetical protein